MRQLFVVLLICASAFCKEEASVKLQFLPNVPVTQTDEVNIEMHQTLPGFKLDAKSKQVFQTEMKIISDLPVAQPPLNLLITVKDVSIDMNINDTPFAYKTKEGDSAQSEEGAQLSKVVNRPINLRFGEKFKMEDKNPELDKLMEQLPVLEELNFDEVLKEIFMYMFALSGKDLQVGTTSIIEIPTEFGTNVPLIVTATVSKIDDTAVYANFVGNLNAVDVPMENEIVLPDNKTEKVTMSVSGKFNGTGKWNRENALLHDIQTQFDISGKVKASGLEWPLSVNGTVSMTSK